MIPGVENQAQEDARKAKVSTRHDEQTDTRTLGQVAFVKPMGPVTVGESDARDGATNTSEGVGSMGEAKNSAPNHPGTGPIGGGPRPDDTV